MDVELKPCPFCGKSCATVTNTKEMERPSTCFMYTVVCDATEDGCGTTMGYAFEKDEAITAWNTRHAHSPDAGKMGEEWRTIESAPVSGQWVLLWWRTCRKPLVGHYVCGESGSGWRCEGDQCIPVNQQDCTHWRPLPAPPAMQQGGGG